MINLGHDRSMIAPPDLPSLPPPLADLARSASWESVELPFAWRDFSTFSYSCISALITRHVGEHYGPVRPARDAQVVDQMVTLDAAIDGGRERFYEILRFLCEHGTVPGRPILLSVQTGQLKGLTILDGHHRVAALCAYRSSRFRQTLGSEAAEPAQRHAALIGYPRTRR